MRCDGALASTSGHVARTSRWAHTDVVGPVEVASIRGAHYIVTTKDDKTGFAEVGLVVVEGDNALCAVAAHHLYSA